MKVLERKKFQFHAKVQGLKTYLTHHPILYLEDDYCISLIFLNS